MIRIVKVKRPTVGKLHICKSSALYLYIYIKTFAFFERMPNYLKTRKLNKREENFQKAQFFILLLVLCLPHLGHDHKNKVVISTFCKIYFVIITTLIITLNVTLVTEKT